MKIKPFIKCPGGKSSLIPSLLAEFPEDFFGNKYNYIEPFVGGGALALHILSKFKPNLGRLVVLNDRNTYIHKAWYFVQQCPIHLCSDYAKLASLPHTKDTFSEIRSELNTSKTQALSRTNVAKFIYLNKNCFNGLIRFNKKGEFNTPFGKYNKVQALNKTNIIQVSSLLQPVPLYSLDFQACIEKLFNTNPALFSDKTLIYFDPPYIPLSKTSSFVSYTSNGFTLYDHYRLKSMIDFLTKIKVKVILSNSAAEQSYELYKNYNILEVLAKRSINSIKTKRHKIKELIIKNF